MEIGVSKPLFPVVLPPRVDKTDQHDFDFLAKQDFVNQNSRQDFQMRPGDVNIRLTPKQQTVHRSEKSEQKQLRPAQ